MIQRSTHRRRFTSFEVVALAPVWLEQDGKCYLCHEQMHPTPVYLNRTRSDPLLATIDHRIPRKRGGLHTRENVSLAHLRCNQKKGRKTVEEYLATLPDAA